MIWIFADTLCWINHASHLGRGRTELTAVLRCCGRSLTDRTKMTVWSWLSNLIQRRPTVLRFSSRLRPSQSGITRSRGAVQYDYSSVILFGSMTEWLEQEYRHTDFLALAIVITDDEVASLAILTWVASQLNCESVSKHIHQSVMYNSRVTIILAIIMFNRLYDHHLFVFITNRIWYLLF